MKHIFGVLIGFGLLIIVAPVVLWFAESQHRAEDFATAAQVEATSQATGYLVVEAQPQLQTNLTCPQLYPSDDIEQCLYVRNDVEQYTKTEKKQCGNITNSNVEIIKKLPNDCSNQNANSSCDECYLVADYDWVKQTNDSTVTYAEFTLGSYSILPNQTATIIGSKQDTQYYNGATEANPVVGDKRSQYTYLPLAKTVLVAGEADSKLRISGAADKVFVVSTLPYTATLVELKNQDTTMKWGLRLASLLAVIVAMTLLAKPLTAFTNIARVIPFVGKHLDRGIDGVIIFLAALVGIVVWLGLWMSILLLKNIWLIIILVVVIAIGLGLLMRRRSKAVLPTTVPPVK